MRKSNYFKLSHKDCQRYCYEASVAEELSSMFLLYPNGKISVESVSQEEYLDHKAQLFIQNNKCQPVEMTTRSGLPVLYVQLPASDEEDSMAHYIVEENGYKRIMMTTLGALVGGLI